MANKCKGLKADGSVCERNAKDGEEYCFQHDPVKSELKALATEELVVEMPPVKQIIRYVSRDNTAQEGSWNNDWIEAYLSEYVNQGYKLVSAYPFDQNEFGIGMVYVLTL